MATNENTATIINYRIEKISNGYVLHVSRGKDGAVSKFAFLTKDELLQYLSDVL